MSHDSNTILVEEAGHLVDYWEGTLHAELLRHALAAGDYEGLASHVDAARAQMLSLEYYPEGLDNDVY